MNITKNFASRRQSWRDSWQDHAKIFATVNLLLSENLGEIRGSIPARFWPPGLLLPSKNLGEIRGRIPTRFWPLGILFPSKNLAGIPARFTPGRKISAAKILLGSQRDSCRDRGRIPPRFRYLFYKGRRVSEEFFLKTCMIRGNPGSLCVTCDII